MVDANMRWTPDEAIRAARAFQPFQLAWLEEPTIPDDVLGHARIVREGGLPVATGENLHTLYEFAQMIHAGGVTFPEPDVTNCGGVTVFMKVARLAEAYNLPVTSHGAHDITVHLAGRRAQPLLSRSARLRARPLHRAAAADPGRVRRCAGPPRAWHRVRLEGAGGVPEPERASPFIPALVHSAAQPPVRRVSSDTMLPSQLRVIVRDWVCCNQILLKAREGNVLIDSGHVTRVEETLRLLAPLSAELAR